MKTAAEAVAEAVLDAIANSVEKSLDLSTLNGNKQETGQERSSASSVETLLDCDDETTYRRANSVSDGKNEPVSAIENKETLAASIAEESIQSSVSDSTDSAPTVIHKPMPSETCRNRDEVNEHCSEQMNVQEEVKPADVQLLKEEAVNDNETQKQPDMVIIHVKTPLASEAPTEAFASTERSIAEPPKAEELSEEETQSSVPEDASEVEVQIPEENTVASKVVEATGDDVESVVEEARDEPEQNNGLMRLESFFAFHSRFSY